MKASLEKVSNLGRKLNVEIPAEQVQEAFEKVYLLIRKSATIKGFRQGKAPMGLIRSLYADRAREDVMHKLIGATYEKALEDHNLDPITDPSIQTAHFHEDQVFHYTAEFEVRPTIPQIQLEDIRIEKEKAQLKPEAVERLLNNLRESKAEFVPIFEDRSAVAGDTVEIDFTGYLDGAPMDNGSAQGFRVEIGENKLIPGFEDGLVGMKISEFRTLNLVFPNEYGEESLAGRPVQFEVRLKNIFRKKLPELNDELAKSLGAENGISALRSEIEQSLLESENKRVQEDLRKRLIKELVRRHPIEVPETLLKEQREVVIADIYRKLEDKRVSESEITQYLEKWKLEIEQTALELVQSQFLLVELAEKFKIKIGENDISARLDQYAKQTGIDRSKVEDFYSNERRQRLAFQMLEDQVVEMALQKVTVVEVDTPLNDSEITVPQEA